MKIFIKLTCILRLNFPTVISVESLQNFGRKKALVMSQQAEEGDETSMNAVSFPISWLMGDSSFGKDPCHFKS